MATLYVVLALVLLLERLQCCPKGRTVTEYPSRFLVLGEESAHANTHPLCLCLFAQELHGWVKGKRLSLWVLECELCP